MKNKLRKAKKNSPDVFAEGTNSTRVWDLRVLFEQEPRLWAACFRTPKSFVVLANCVATSRGVSPIDPHSLDLQAQNFLMQPFLLPNLGKAGTIVHVGIIQGWIWAEILQSWHYPGVDLGQNLAK